MATSLAWVRGLEGFGSHRLPNLGVNLVELPKVGSMCSARVSDWFMGAGSSRPSVPTPKTASGH